MIRVCVDDIKIVLVVTSFETNLSFDRILIEVTFYYYLDEKLAINKMFYHVVRITL